MLNSGNACVVKCWGTDSQRMFNVPAKIWKNYDINKGDLFYVTIDGQNRIVYERFILKMREEGNSSPNDTYKVISPSSAPNQDDQEAIND